MKNIIIYGAGGLGRDIADMILTENKANILGFIDDNKAGKKIDNFNIYNFEQVKKEFSDFYLVLAVGDPIIKSKIKSKLEPEEVKYANIVSEDAYVSKSADLGRGCVVYPEAILGANVKLGDHVLICGNTSIGHDAVVKDMSSIAFNCSIGGNTIIGRDSYVGSGTHIKDELEIGKNCIVGMNSSLLNDLSSSKIYYNKIKKTIKENKKRGIF